MTAARRLGTHTEEDWQALLAEVNGECMGCGERGLSLVKDHIVPISAGGSDAIANLQPLCNRCNAIKGTKTINYLAEWRMGLR